MTVCGASPKGGQKMQWNKITIPKMKTKKKMKENAVRKDSHNILSRR